MQDTAVFERDEVSSALTRVAHEVVERNPDGGVALVGIYTRGVYIARRLKALVEEFSQFTVDLGDVDISFYRDDVASRAPEPTVHSSTVEFELEGKTVVLVDDVLFTGRTVRAAMEALFDYGRPERVQLAVLIDRGHHELPIKPDYVGKNIPTSRSDRVNVLLAEYDDVADEVTLSSARQQAASEGVDR